MLLSAAWEEEAILYICCIFNCCSLPLTDVLACHATLTVLSACLLWPSYQQPNSVYSCICLCVHSNTSLLVMYITSV